MEFVIPEFEVTTRKAVADALRIGGRARVSVKSLATGQHLTVRLACKRRGEDGKFISRARKVGRVGFDECDALFVDGDAAFDGWIATWYADEGEWRQPKSYVDPRGAHYAWAAKAVVAWALDGAVGLEEQAEIRLANECCICGHKLEHPESVDRGIGPECLGKLTAGQHV